MTVQLINLAHWLTRPPAGKRVIASKASGRHLSRRPRRIAGSGHAPGARGARPRGVVAPLEEMYFQPEAESAICVQSFDDSLNSAIRTTYRISLRSSSLREPRYPLLEVVWIHIRYRRRKPFAINTNNLPQPGACAPGCAAFQRREHGEWPTRAVSVGTAKTRGFRARTTPRGPPRARARNGESQRRYGRQGGYG